MTKSLTKVLILTHNYPTSKTDRQNAGTFIYDLAKEMKKQIQVEVMAPGLKDVRIKLGTVFINQFEWKGPKLGQLKIWNPFDILKFFNYFKAGKNLLVNYLSTTQPQITVSMWAFPSGYFAYWLKKKYKIPYVIWALGSDVYIYAKVPILGRLIRKILQDADLLLADGIDLAKVTGQIAGRECIFLPSASKFQSARNVSKSKKTSEKITLTFLGRLEPVKGPDLLIDALVLLGKKINNYQVNIIGDGSLMAALKQQSAKLPPSIIFYGNISDKSRIALILKNSDWVVIPSRSDSFPLVASEALKMSIPLIVSALPDLSYLIDKYHVGYKFKVEDAEDLSRIFKELPTRQVQSKLFKSNTVKAARVFSVDKSARELIKMIRQFI